MFRGITAVNVDVKNRVTIPASHRTKIQDISEGQLVLTIDTQEPCLLLYPAETWLEIEARLQDLPSFNPATRRIQRLLIGHATDLALDRHGRILLPNLLREYATLDKTVMLVGQGKKFEIWDEALWERARESYIAGRTEENNVPPELLTVVL